MENLVIEKADRYEDIIENDCKSHRRRATINEKIIIIFITLFSAPFGALFEALKSNVNVFDYFPLWVFLLLIWLINAFLSCFLEFALKNLSLYKGLLRTFFTSIFISSPIFLASSLLFASYDSSSAFSYKYFALFTCICYLGFMLIARIITILIVKMQKVKIMIIGPKKDADELAKRIFIENNKRVNIRYIFYFENGVINESVKEKIKNVNTIILLDSLKKDLRLNISMYLNECLNKDLYISTTFYDILLTSPSQRNIADILSYEQKPFVIDKVEAFVKRAFDIFISLFFLILTSIIWIIIPILIKLCDHGPVFYKQVRLTQGMKEFKIIKFRSMKVDAEKIGGAQLAKANDDRVTPIGKFIRATRIDEFPQILNILKGDMSFVGPRPERPEFVKDFIKENPLYEYRYNVKAGLTGYQQVKCSYHTGYSDKLRYDLQYIKDYSFFFDIYIILLTIKTVLSKDMAEGITAEDLSLREYLNKINKIYVEHDGYLRIVNHKI